MAPIGLHSAHAIRAILPPVRVHNLDAAAPSRGCRNPETPPAGVVVVAVVVVVVAVVIIRRRRRQIKGSGGGNAQRAREVELWRQVQEAFSAFAAATAEWARVTQNGLDTRAQVLREFSTLPERDELAATLTPAIGPTPSNLARVVAVLSSQVPTIGTSLVLPPELETAGTPDPPFSEIMKESEAPPWGFVRSGSRSH